MVEVSSYELSEYLPPEILKELPTPKKRLKNLEKKKKFMENIK